MKENNRLSKIKSSKLFTPKLLTVFAIIALFVVISTVQFGAVDFSGGVEQVTNEVKNQAKSIMVTIFGAVALFALCFTVFKGIAAAFNYRRGEAVHYGPVIAGGIGTIVAGLCASATFFGWFGL